jgi:hypothetical protein
MHRSVRMGGAIALGAVVFVLRDASAADPAPSLFTDAARTAPAPYALPPAPALPAGCAVPSKDQCADGSWYKTDTCAKDPAKSAAIQNFCAWTFQKAWVDTQADAHPTLFPTSPPSSPNPILTPGIRTEHGKSVPARTRAPRCPSPRRATRRRWACTDAARRGHLGGRRSRAQRPPQAEAARGERPPPVVATCLYVPIRRGEGDRRLVNKARARSLDWVKRSE